MSFIDELKRRNVFKVGIAYLVGSWLLIQVADILLDNIGAPAWVLQTLFVALGVGFFITLFFAWAFEMTPEGVKREKDVDRSHSITPQTGKKLNNTILALMAVVIAYLLFDKFSVEEPDPIPTPANGIAENSSSGKPDPALNIKTEAEPAINRLSIAVLPFDNRSNREEDQFFTDGIHDDLLTTIAKIGSMKVISRTSVMEYKGTTKKIPEIARELGVANILEGGIQRSGNQVRINVQLIDAVTDEHLWAEIFDRELTAENLFAIQSEISGEIAKALETTLSPEEQQRVNERPTESLAAYSAYLRGRQLLARRNAESIDLALTEFQRAVDIDPGFALAWVGVADSAQLALRYSDMDRPEAEKLSSEAIARALAINDRLGEAHLARAEFLYRIQRRYEEAELAYKLAIKFSPGYAQGWQRYANFLVTFPKRLNEALDLAKKAAELDPLSAIVQNQITSALTRLGRFEEAEQRLLQLIEQDPQFAETYNKMAELKLAAGQFDEAIFWLHRAQSLDPGNIRYVLYEMWPQMAIGNTDELDTLLARMEIMDPNSSTLSFMEVFINIYKQNYPAALEAAHTFDQKTGYRPNGKGPQMYVQTMMGNYASAREAGESALPDYFIRQNWARSIEEDPETSCFIAWLLTQTNDEEMGIELSLQTSDYVLNESRNVTENPKYYALELCQIVLGRSDDALTSFEQRVKANQFKEWWLDMKHPAYQLLRHEPHFQNIQADIQHRTSVQREALLRMETEAGL